MQSLVSLRFWEGKFYMPIRPTGICGLLPYPCGLMSSWAFVLWASVLWAFVLWAFVLWAFVRIPPRGGASNDREVVDDANFQLFGGYLIGNVSKDLAYSPSTAFQRSPNA